MIWRNRDAGHIDNGFAALIDNTAVRDELDTVENLVVQTDFYNRYPVPFCQDFSVRSEATECGRFTVVTLLLGDLGVRHAQPLLRERLVRVLTAAHHVEPEARVRQPGDHHELDRREIRDDELLALRRLDRRPDRRDDRV